MLRHYMTEQISSPSHQKLPGKATHIHIYGKLYQFWCFILYSLFRVRVFLDRMQQNNNVYTCHINSPSVLNLSLTLICPQQTRTIPLLLIILYKWIWEKLFSNLALFSHASEFGVLFNRVTPNSLAWLTSTWTSPATSI
jgi:hypothetical protein